MSLDQRLSQAARQVAGGVTPPDVDLGVVRARARTNQRRTAVLGVAAAIVAVVAVGAVVVNGRPGAAPEPVLPLPTPSRTEAVPGWSPKTITAKDIVTAADAKPVVVGVALGDADARLAIWRSSSSYAGVAVTTDGYQTTIYITIPGVDRGAFTVLSPRDDLFLVTDGDNVDWLIGVDGSVRRVTREHGEVKPGEDALWFQCGNDGWRSTWCALDADAARAYVWPHAWDGSAVPPQTGAVPWGANPEPRAVGNTGVLEAWWGTGSNRQVRSLAPALHGDYVLGCPSDLMALWSVESGGSAVRIHTSRDGGATWQTASYRAPTADQWWKVRCAPDGSFVAADSERGIVVWRAEASGDSFEKVFAAPGTEDSIGIADLRVDGGRMYASGVGVAAISEDSGKTWTRVRTWR